MVLPLVGLAELNVGAIGVAFTVTVKAAPGLFVHPPAFDTVTDPVYTAAGAAAGTVSVIGEAGKAVNPTLTKLAPSAAAFQVILY